MDVRVRPGRRHRERHGTTPGPDLDHDRARQALRPLQRQLDEAVGVRRRHEDAGAGSHHDPADAAAERRIAEPRDRREKRADRPGTRVGLERCGRPPGRAERAVEEPASGRRSLRAGLCGAQGSTHGPGHSRLSRQPPDPIPVRHALSVGEEVLPVPPVVARPGSRRLDGVVDEERSRLRHESSVRPWGCAGPQRPFQRSQRARGKRRGRKPPVDHQIDAAVEAPVRHGKQPPGSSTTEVVAPRQFLEEAANRLPVVGSNEELDIGGSAWKRVRTQDEDLDPRARQRFDQRARRRGRGNAHRVGNRASSA